jgi:hypothetical protein
LQHDDALTFFHVAKVGFSFFGINGPLFGLMETAAFLARRMAKSGQPIAFR